MKGLKKPQLLALVAAVVLIVLLVLAPRTPAHKESAVTPMDPAEARLAEAVAMVNGEDPMRGIMLLREILQEDPDNVDAHWQLGLFSVQSGQYDKALERFKKVLELDPEKFPDAWFYMGRTYATLDSNVQAIASLKKYRTLTQDTVILAGVDRFLFELENAK